jgi:hypothetical protein
VSPQTRVLALGLTTRYRADIDHPPDHLRKRLEEVQSKDHTSPELTRRYTELMKKFKPVMRHYFTEKHREPMAWFSMRLNYIRSVAVTSIVGHILGIGDRHCSNILIDKLTGELVHIDFGIVFEDVSTQAYDGVTNHTDTRRRGEDCAFPRRYHSGSPTTSSTDWV